MRNVEWWCSIIVVTACSRGVPAVPATSAASEGASAAPLPVVGVALREDPPPPGGNADHWPGLGASAPMEHHHHGGDAGAMPGM